MRKRTTALLLSALLVLTTIVSGCGKPKSTALFSWEDRKLNIIEDNYRNYYEIFVRSFYDSDGHSLGDLKGVTGKLDYIKNILYGLKQKINLIFLFKRPEQCIDLVCILSFIYLSSEK